MKKAKTQPRQPKAMRVIGIQSGNAVDGFDVGIFDFEPAVISDVDERRLAEPLKYKVLANKTFPLNAEKRELILGLRALNRSDGADYARGNYQLGKWFAQCANDLMKEAGIDKSTVHLVSSHGQSVCGHPHWELGDISVIAQETGITTAGDFRPADVAAGGNGTPCTCTFDSIFLRPKAGAGKWRVAINIGGTSSVTFLPPWPTNEEDASGAAKELVPIGLDPGLGVFFIDLCVKKINPALEYDANGDMARSGKINDALLAEFLSYKYYQQTELPVGVGVEDFPETLFQKWCGRAKELGVSDVDLLTTLTELTAKQIAMACARFGGKHVANGATDDILCRGGVLNNKYFVERLIAQLNEQLKTNVTRLSTLEDLNMDEDSWENAMYAMFGYLCFTNLYNFVPSCTGARYPVVGGKIAPGGNFNEVLLKNL